MALGESGKQENRKKNGAIGSVGGEGFGEGFG
jgi:hypothetical protein